MNTINLLSSNYKTKFFLLIFICFFFSKNLTGQVCSDVTVWSEATWDIGSQVRLSGGTTIYSATSTTAAPLTDQNSRCDPGHWNWPDCNGENFQPWDMVGTCTVVLPVTLLNFYGDKKSSTVDLNWETGSEINSDYFEILHTTDGVNFKSIGKVNAAGNSNVSLQYNLTHYHPKQGANYYKLREYDLDGGIHDYKTIYVDFEFVDVNYQFTVYPNPAKISGDIYLKTNYIGEIQVNLFDMNGKIVKSNLLNVINEEFLVFNNLNLSPGVYPLVISSPNNAFLSKTIKLIIQ